MEESTLVKIVIEKLVKPSSPTPPSSKYYKLSLFDATMVNKPVPLAFFYPKKNFHGINPCMEVLEISLSKTLDHYYPFAGRLTDNGISIDCNDAGVQVREVQIDASMSEILDHPRDNSVKNVVFPRELYCYSTTQSRLMVQLNHFTCGGICVAIIMSHELGDGITFSNFFNDWAAVTRAISCDIHPLPSIAPIFPGASIFPPLDDSICGNTNNSSTFSLEKFTNVTQRFVFSGPSISKLKRLVANDGDLEIEFPSKVEVVTALIFKSIVLAFQKMSGSFKSSSLSHAINLRPLTGLPLSENYVGNLTLCFSINVTEERELKLSRLVTELKNSKVKVVDSFRSACLEGKELVPVVLKHWMETASKCGSNKLEMYVFSSICKMPFYQVDFGWGNPNYFFTTLSEMIKKVVLLMDTPDGDGIEVFVTLEQDQMSILQKDEELLSFATLNPKICVPS